MSLPFGMASSSSRLADHSDDAERAKAQRLGERLVACGKLTPADLERALEAQQQLGGMLGQVLVRLGLVAELDVAQVLAEQLGVELVRREAFPATAPALGRLNPSFLIANRVLPLGPVEETERFAAAVPQDTRLAHALRLALGRPVRLCLGLESEIEATLEAWFLAPEEEGETGGVGDGEAVSEFVEHLRDLASEAPVIQRVNQLFARAVELGASDIHIEPFEDAFVVRCRVDGVLRVIDEPPRELAPAIVSRIKLLSRLNIAERRLPQDGRMKIRVHGHELDVRVSTVPTAHGESVVMRLLERNLALLALDALGFEEDILAQVRALLGMPHGIFLVTGPTGSGKTTTLYAALRALDATELKILTVEDPVEYQIPWINQVQVQPQIDLTFANVLRSFLRQDPDVIMVGEMRDGETAQIAVQAALTGHLVLSTLHTNTAAGAVVRLHDMGVERYLITSSVIGIMAQRLVRALCPACRAPVPPERRQAVAEVLGLPLPGDATLFEPVGCPACRGSGYRGRRAIHELLVFDRAVKQAILAGADADAIDAAAVGKRSLLQDGARKVFRGITSAEEVLRVARAQD
ncbi:MAG: Flp pilus assembly complex ATPase component TadA [Tepidiphilus sp.]|nr:Flp pilus assembly complex ATPase component TadA [Tepidiphilus sp.]